MNRNTSVYSDLKILYHTKHLEKLLKNERMAPIYVRIKPTNVCNQRCYYCVYAEDQVFADRHVDRRESIPWDKMQEIINDLSDIGTKAVTFSGGGEPLCYHSIVPALKLVKEKGLDYSMITNAQALCGEAAEELRDAKWIRVSLDSANGDTYHQIRGVKTYNQVIQNIENFAKIKSSECVLGINYVVTKDNFEQVFKICELAKGMGVNNIKFAPLMIQKDTADYHNGIKEQVKQQIERAKKEFESDDFAIIDKYSDDLLLDESFEKSYCSCYIKGMFTVIGADSKVYYCHQRAYIPAGEVGDISGQSFKNMWFSEETTRKFNQMDAKKECNFRCVFEERNMLLNDIMNMDKRHINFI